MSCPFWFVSVMEGLGGTTNTDAERWSASPTLRIFSKAASPKSAQVLREVRYYIRHPTPRATGRPGGNRHRGTGRRLVIARLRADRHDPNAVDADSSPSVGLFQVETCNTSPVIVKTPRLCQVTPWSVTPTGAFCSLTFGCPTAGPRRIPRPSSPIGSTSSEPEPFAPKPVALIAVPAAADTAPTVRPSWTGLAPKWVVFWHVPEYGGVDGARREAGSD